MFYHNKEMLLMLYINVISMRRGCIYVYIGVSMFPD